MVVLVNCLICLFEVGVSYHDHSIELVRCRPISQTYYLEHSLYYQVFRVVRYCEEPIVLHDSQFTKQIHHVPCSKPFQVDLAVCCVKDLLLCLGWWQLNNHRLRRTGHFCVVFYPSNDIPQLYLVVDFAELIPA